jgi:hypothetical protein
MRNYEMTFEKLKLPEHDAGPALPVECVQVEIPCLHFNKHHRKSREQENPKERSKRTREDQTGGRD